MQKYKKFVEKVTSDNSKNFNDFVSGIEIVENSYKINTPRALTALVGLQGESGEFADILKKVFFQGKELDEESIKNLKKELGDVIFYWMNGCLALGFDPEEVIDENIIKLSQRYPNGFSVERSNNRKDENNE